MPEQVPIGTILVLRSDFDRVANNQNKPTALRHRASLMVQLLDELITRREKEGMLDDDE